MVCGLITLSACALALLGVVLWAATVTVSYGDTLFVYTIKSNQRWYLSVQSNSAVSLGNKTTATAFFVASAASQGGAILSNEPLMLGFVDNLGSTSYVGSDVEQQVVVKPDQTLLCVPSWPIMYDQVLAVNIYLSDLTLEPATSENNNYNKTLVFAQEKQPNVQWYFQDYALYG